MVKRKLMRIRLLIRTHYKCSSSFLFLIQSLFSTSSLFPLHCSSPYSSNCIATPLETISSDSTFYHSTFLFLSLYLSQLLILLSSLQSRYLSALSLLCLIAILHQIYSLLSFFTKTFFHDMHDCFIPFPVFP